MIVRYINYQFQTYSYYKVDPKAEVANSFTASWCSLKSYVFPPFLVISRTLKKIKAEKAEDLIMGTLLPRSNFISSAV